MGNFVSALTSPVTDSSDLHYSNEQLTTTAPRDWLGAELLPYKRPKPAWRVDELPKWPKNQSRSNATTQILEPELHSGLEHHQRLLAETQRAIKDTTNPELSRQLRGKARGVKQRIRRMERTLKRAEFTTAKQDITLVNESRKGTLVVESLILEIRGLTAYIRDVEYYQIMTKKMKRHDIEKALEEGTKRFHQTKLDQLRDIDYEVKRAFDQAKDELKHTIATLRSFIGSGVKPPTIWLPGVATNQQQSQSTVLSSVQEPEKDGSDISDFSSTLSVGCEH